MEPYEKYLSIKKKLEIAGIFTGCNVLNLKYKLTFPSYVTMFVEFYVAFATIYTAYHFYPDYEMILKTLTSAGMVVQVV